MASFPTVVTPTTRFFDAGIAKIYFLTTIAATTLLPTRAELTAGKDLTPEIGAIDGWVIGAGEIETPDLGSTFTSKIPGKTSVDDSSLTFYQSQTGADIRTVLPRDTVGFIVIMDGGDVAAQPMDVFPVRVRANGKTRTTGEDAAMIRVPFSITRRPAENLAIPANP